MLDWTVVGVVAAFVVTGGLCGVFTHANSTRRTLRIFADAQKPLPVKTIRRSAKTIK